MDFQGRAPLQHLKQTHPVIRGRQDIAFVFWTTQEFSHPLTSFIKGRMRRRSCSMKPSSRSSARNILPSPRRMKRSLFGIWGLSMPNGRTDILLWIWPMQVSKRMKKKWWINKSSLNTGGPFTKKPRTKFEKTISKRSISLNKSMLGYKLK